MEKNQGTFRGKGGIELFYQRWRPDTQPIAVFAIVHGLGDYSGRYMNLVNGLSPHGYEIYGFDLRGHGRSPGGVCHVNDWDEFRMDLKAFLQLIHAEEPHLPIFLFGHSMGSLIVLDYVLREPGGLQGAILSGLPLEPVGVGNSVQILAARLLSGILPKLTFNVALDTSALSRDPKEVEAYENDPLVHGLTTVRWGTEAMQTVKWVKEHPTQVRLPILIVHGSADRINAASGSQAFYDAVTFPNKEIIIYPGSYHEIHNDLDKDRLIPDLQGWMERHMQVRETPVEMGEPS